MGHRYNKSCTVNVEKRITYEIKLPKVNSKVQEKNYKNNKDKRQKILAGDVERIIFVVFNKTTHKIFSQSSKILI